MKKIILRNENSLWTVSEITREIKGQIENQFTGVAVIGEITNLTKQASGHFYFTLKDSGAQLGCVLFRGNTMNLFFRPQNGMQVVCRGGISVYEPRGVYQLIVSSMTPHGEGALQLAFEKMKRRLFEEGIFDESKKKQIPAFPRKIGVITSSTGAVLQDILHIKEKKDPSIEITLVPVQVQGAGAAEQIVSALDLCNAHRSLDVIILARGGGSLEDLWPFNEEIVAMAISRSTIPVVTGIGHEIDYTIADFVSDLRAPTPSVAADLVFPSRESVFRTLHLALNTQQKSLHLKLRDEVRNLYGIIHHRAFVRLETLFASKSQRIAELYDDIASHVQNKADTIQANLTFCQRLLENHNVSHVLKKGYAIIRKDGDVVSSVQNLCPKEVVELQLHDGFVFSTIREKGDE